MTRSQTIIPFHSLTFHDDLPKLRDVEKRLTNFLKTTREKAQRAEIEAGRMTDDDRIYPYDLVGGTDKQRIKGRAIWAVSDDMCRGIWRICCEAENGRNEPILLKNSEFQTSQFFGKTP